MPEVRFESQTHHTCRYDPRFENARWGSLEDIKKPHSEGLKKGFENLDKHIRNMQAFGQTVVVCFNRYATDVDSEIELCREHCENMGVGFAVNNAFSEGGKGAVELAELVVDAIANRPSRPVVFSYTDRDNIETKAEKSSSSSVWSRRCRFQPQPVKCWKGYVSWV